MKPRQHELQTFAGTVNPHKKNWHLILDDACDGFYNMAKDELLIELYRENRVPLFRVYSWSRPFISIGYAQNPHDITKEDIFARDVPLVRRITGGGALLHDNELTYSLVLDTQDLFLPKRIKASYRALNQFLINFYASLGLVAQFAQDARCKVDTRCGTYCFASNEAFDIVIDDKKIGGNAQRRMRDIIFQHGSIPLSLVSHRKERENKHFFKHGLIESFARTFSLTLQEIHIEKTHASRLSELCARYESREWNFRYEKVSMA